VRARARALGLETADKPESQEICFVPTGDYRDLLRRRLPERHPALEPGPLVTVDGDVIGEHAGYAGFTIGQRKGLGGGFDAPHFVVAIRPETRAVVIGPREALLSDVVEVEAPHWLGEPPRVGDQVGVQLRHRAREVGATVERMHDGCVALALAIPQAAVTPGQSAVMFAGDRVLGGGRIAPPQASASCASRGGPERLASASAR
jgi:tRNA-specific 2-thiouridylase